MSTTIYTNRENTIKAFKFISQNRIYAYIGVKENNTYYNINDIVWKVKHGFGNSPISTNIKIENFKIN